ncbi:hypothetical protein [Methylomonas sp. AM2-LC]|uniref:hypothetical protein n=1 Tax=Methylomonas sp. AM2-LC TaxID=3153301 RepID=UPI003263989E
MFPLSKEYKVYHHYGIYFDDADFQNVPIFVATQFTASARYQFMLRQISECFVPEAKLYISIIYAAERLRKSIGLDCVNSMQVIDYFLNNQLVFKFL